jgi:hypothetical protein
MRARITLPLTGRVAQARFSARQAGWGEPTGATGTVSVWVLNADRGHIARIGLAW